MNNRYLENQKYRMSDYIWRKLWFQDENMSFFKCIKARKYSRYQHLRDSAYDNYMTDGLCYGNFLWSRKNISFKIKIHQKY